MKSFAVLSLFAAVALAQSSTPNPLIPDNISSGCKSFLNSLNTDTSLQACTDSLIKATANFGPGGSSSSNPTKEAVNEAVNGICTGSTSDACPDDLIRGKLADFYGACSAELTSSPNQQVRNLYDVLYVMTPMKKSLCSKDDSGNYCVLSSDGSTAAKGAITKATGLDYAGLTNALASNSPLTRRAESAVVANLTTFRDSNVPFIFRDPDMDSTALCATCTRNILTNYFNFESDVLYASGLGNSQLLGGQDALVGSIQEKCGANFLNGAVQAAGGIKQDTLSSAAVRDVSNNFASLVAVVAGAMPLVVSSLL
jgi:hypothetical protein